jgi:sulfur relay (sulfurtransferase) DsrF/TusC family protein
VVVITEDPFKNHRPAEALRIALGLSSGDDLRATIILRGAAARLLTGEAEDAVDGEELAARYLPIFREWKTTFLVDEAAAAELERAGTDFNYTARSESAIAAELANADRVLIF